MNDKEKVMAEECLIQELDMGWESGEKDGWYSAQSIRNYFKEKALTIETKNALLEAERISKDASVKGYHDLSEMFAELRK